MNDVIYSERVKVLITSDAARHHYINLEIERLKEIRSNVYQIRLTGTVT